ncbi:MAG TPA: hypothetical protein VFH47_03700 [Candidatus Thermoplasmatota archaeon]|nr:hypothetical protein [Candidatus Thermoplasmatota archaeon]
MDERIPEAPHQTREFKVHIPLHLHFELHRQRLITGASISDTMERALQAYLAARVPE